MKKQIVQDTITHWAFKPFEISLVILYIAKKASVY